MPLTQHLSVVIIEPSALVRERIVDLVSRLPRVQVRGAAETGRHGLELCAAQTPQVVMLGLELEDMNGLKFLQQLRGQRPECRIIALTNCPFKGVLQLSLECGADFCFDKTTEIELALGVCSQLANHSELRPSPPAHPENGSMN